MSKEKLIQNLKDLQKFKTTKENQIKELGYLIIDHQDEIIQLEENIEEIQYEIDNYQEIDPTTPEGGKTVYDFLDSIDVDYEVPKRQVPRVTLLYADKKLYAIKVKSKSAQPANSPWNREEAKEIKVTYRTFNIRDPKQEKLSYVPIRVKDISEFAVDKHTDATPSYSDRWIKEGDSIVLQNVQFNSKGQATHVEWGVRWPKDRIEDIISNDKLNITDLNGSRTITNPFN